ncbi:MAG: ABC transporter substrate-binding protein [Gemmatimonadota bacterium]
MRHLLAFSLLLAVACASGTGSDTGRISDRDLGIEARAAAEALRRVQATYEAGDFAGAVRGADSLYLSWKGKRGFASVANRALSLKAAALEGSGDLSSAAEALGELLDRLRRGPVFRDAVRRLAAIRKDTGDQVGALRILLAHPGDVGDSEVELMREAMGAASREELETLVRDFPIRDVPSAVVHAELARRLALSGQLERAKGIARAVQAANPPEQEQELAGLLVGMESERLSGPLKVGAVLPLSGRFGGVGALLREGIEVAVAEARSGRDAFGAVAKRVEILYRDDGSDPERSIELVGELDRSGVLAVLGPVRSESFAAAARARRNRRLLLVSPTATSILEPAPNAYTLWATERRERDAARDVGVWTTRELGLRRAVILYPNDPSGRAALDGFTRGVREGGAMVVGSETFEPAATTFELQVESLAELEPDLVFLAAESTPSVLMAAPQLPYYGLDHAVISGGAAWSDPAVVRRLDPAAADFRVIGTFMDRSEENSEWSRFKLLYEKAYRKPLRDNLLPALGHDAAELVLRALANVRLPLPGAVSAEVARGEPTPGATGLLDPDPASSTVGRRTLIRMLYGGRLVKPDRGEILAWLERARFRADSIAQARADSLAALKDKPNFELRRNHR